MPAGPVKRFLRTGDARAYSSRLQMVPFVIRGLWGIKPCECRRTFTRTSLGLSERCLLICYGDGFLPLATRPLSSHPANGCLPAKDTSEDDSAGKRLLTASGVWSRLWVRPFKGLATHVTSRGVGNICSCEILVGDTIVISPLRPVASHESLYTLDSNSVLCQESGEEM